MYAGNQKNLQAIGKSQFVLLNALNKYLQELMKKGVTGQESEVRIRRQESEVSPATG